MIKHPVSGAGHLIAEETGTWVGSGEGRCNEDFALIDRAHRCAVLVDGATGLTKAHIVSGESDAAWFARNLSQSLADALSDGATTVIEAFVHAGSQVAAAYHALPGSEALKRIDEPNGSVATLRWNATQVEVSLLGDCTAVVLMRDGSACALHDDTLTLLDEQNYQRMYEYACARGTTMAVARKALNPRFVENRLKMNEPGGYWAADISCRGMEHVWTSTYSRSDVAGIFACSDGYAAAVDMGVAASPEELAGRVAAGEGDAIAQALRSAEHEDAGCWRVHRSKTSDDATYFFVSLAEESEA